MYIWMRRERERWGEILYLGLMSCMIIIPWACWEDQTWWLWYTSPCLVLFGLFRQELVVDITTICGFFLDTKLWTNHIQLALIITLKNWIELVGVPSGCTNIWPGNHQASSWQGPRVATRSWRPSCLGVTDPPWPNPTGSSGLEVHQGWLRSFSIRNWTPTYNNRGIVLASGFQFVGLSVHQAMEGVQII